MAKYTFELIGGSHYQDGKRYFKGAQITSPKRLDQIFKEKFKLLHDDEVEVTKPDDNENKLSTKTAVITKKANGKYVVFQVEREMIEDLTAKELKALKPEDVEDVGERMHEGYLKLAQAKALLEPDEDEA